MISAFVVVDLESTSREPADAHIVEWAAVRIEPEWFGTGRRMETHGGLVRPPVHIPPETSAVHQITDSDVSEAPTWEEESKKLYTLLAPEGVIAVAHNAAYERELLSKTVGLPPVPFLCTYKAALRVWPDAPAHNNETLRYWLGYGTGRKVRQAPHSAGHDAEVTANILNDLLLKAKVEDMLKWTNEPALLPTCPLGDWRGRKWAEVDEGFLLWIMRKIHDREDVRFCAQAELDRRERERAAARAASQQASEDDTVPF